MDRTIRSVKRQMGTDWSVNIDAKKFTPQQISVFVLPVTAYDPGMPIMQ